MAFVVLDDCIRCRYTDCVEICPVEDCFHEGPNMLVIDPNTCIECAECGPLCPVGAIMDSRDVDQNRLQFLEINAKYAQLWPAINHRTAPLPDADKWANVVDKYEYFEP